MGKFERGIRRRMVRDEEAEKAARARFAEYPGTMAVQAKLETMENGEPMIHTFLECDGNEAMLCLAVVVKDLAVAMPGDPGLNAARVSSAILNIAADMVEAATGGN